MFNYLKSGFILLLTLFSATNVQTAGGIALDITRVICPADAKQASLSISNSDTKKRYLVNSWIENNAGVKEKSFAIMPSLFVSEPESKSTLRIIYAGVPLPKDRESLLWMNVKTIPSVNKNSLEGKNVLWLVILSRIKLFVRPNNLPQAPEDVLGVLKFSRTGNHLKINNPSAYYATSVNPDVGKTKVDNAMVASKSDAQVLLPAGIRSNVTFQTVNDHDAMTPARTISVRWDNDE